MTHVNVNEGSHHLVQVGFKPTLETRTRFGDQHNHQWRKCVYRGPAMKEYLVELQERMVVFTPKLLTVLALESNHPPPGTHSSVDSGEDGYDEEDSDEDSNDDDD